MTDAPPPPAAPQPAYGAAPAGKTNTLAIVGLIVAIFFGWVGSILGFVALSQIKKTGEGGRGIALAAVIVGFVVTVISLIVTFAVLVPLFLYAGEVSTYDYGLGALGAL